MSARRRVLLAAWITAAVVVAGQLVARPSNNFQIFRWSWRHLVAGQDLYGPSAAYHDLFLYSPTFALLFAPFAVVPSWLGVAAWTALNAWMLYWALGRVLSDEQVFWARLIVLADAVGAMQQAQSNALVAGLMLLAFADLERRREPRAAAWIGIASAIKIFPLAAATFAIFRPWRVPRFALAGLVIGALLVAAPLLVVSVPMLESLYRSWFSTPSPVGTGYSVMAVARVWTGARFPSWPVQAAGAVVWLAPLVQLPHWGDTRFRRLFLASTLMFCVLFNHAAESPSFVIAMTGVAVWFAVSARDRFSWSLAWLATLGTALASSDVMPRLLQERWLEPYRLKTLPVLVVWLATQWELWRQNVSAPFQAPPAGGAVPAR